MLIKEFFDQATFTLTYVVYDQNTKDAIVIDPVWDYDPASSKLSTASAQNVLSFLKENNLNLHYILETHAHADHISGAQIIKAEYPNSKIVIGSEITKVQSVFKKLYNLDSSFMVDGSQFDYLIKNGEQIRAGSIQIKAIATPGHTPACSSYLIDNCLFVGDSLFMPDSGTGRCDFPEGSADQLYNSIHEVIYSLPEDTRVYVGHDYQPHGRPLKFITSVFESKNSNIQLKGATTKEEYIKFRTERDRVLTAPRLLLPSIQVNINAGKLPAPESNGSSYLKIPLFR